MTKTYTAKQAAVFLGIEYDALQKQLVRDSKKPKSQRKYPHARKYPCGCWVLSEKDFK